MKDLDPSLVPNDLESFAFSHIDIEEQVDGHALRFLDIRDKKVEWGMEIPIFVYAFYDSLSSGNIPSQQEFWNHYQRFYEGKFRFEDLQDHQLKGLKARVFRTYPSLVRDIHFAKFLEAELAEVGVIYNQRLDVEAGIDLLLVTRKWNIAINLYTHTMRAKFGRLRKAGRHGRYANVIYLELPVAFSGCRKVGDFFLYGEREKKQIEQAINQL